MAAVADVKPHLESLNLIELGEGLHRQRSTAIHLSYALTFVARCLLRAVGATQERREQRGCPHGKQNLQRYLTRYP